MFVIHGRNSKARDQIFAFLRALGLAPIEWEQAVQATGQASPYIGNVLDIAFNRAQAIVVLETPDDIAYLRTDLAEGGDPETTPQAQPRPNVLFEAGMAMGRNPDRTIIVEFGQIKQFSDIHGRHTVRLTDTPQMRQSLKSRLETAGCAVTSAGTDWLSTDLTPPERPGGGNQLGRRIAASQSPGRPHFAATHHKRGGNKLDYVEIVNQGPGDAFDVEVEEMDAAAGRGLVEEDSTLTIPKLPAGKSFRMDYMGNIGWGDNKKFFTLLIKARTDAGDILAQEEFVSMT